MAIVFKTEIPHPCFWIWNKGKLKKQQQFEVRNILLYLERLKHTKVSLVYWLGYQARHWKTASSCPTLDMKLLGDLMPVTLSVS